MRQVEYNGKVQTVAEFAALIGYHYQSVTALLRRGLTVEQIAERRGRTHGRGGYRGQVEQVPTGIVANRRGRVREVIEPCDGSDTVVFLDEDGARKECTKRSFFRWLKR